MHRPAGGGVLVTRPLRWPGGSSPVVWNDRIFVTCYSGYGLDESDPGDPADLKRHLVCLNRADGRIIWDRTVDGAAAIPFQRFQARHSYASSTPATDGTLVYVFFEKERVFAFDFDGKQVWKSDVGRRTHNWGSGTSPVLFGDLVIVNASVEAQSLVALNKQTGKKVWRARGIEAYASAVAADGKIYNVTRNSGTFVLAAQPRFEQLANNLLDPDTSICNATPAVADGQLLLRSNQALYCIGQRGR